MLKAKIIGAGGYGGLGILELLLAHPEVEVRALVEIENLHMPVGDLHPHLSGFCDLPLLPASDARAAEPVDVVFMATPDGVGMKLAPEEIDKGAKVIDYSGDFRFNSLEGYRDYAQRIGRSPEHSCPHLLRRAVYGIPELHRAEVGPSTQVVGNPGCFAVSCVLGLAPAVQAGVVGRDGIICDCKTGVSGAGKKPIPTFHFPARYDQMNAYKLAGHQHVCEIERELSLAAGDEVRVTFTAQVMPVCRGILSTLYGRLVRPMTEARVLELYRGFYAHEPFVRVYDSTASLGTQQVRGSNYCNLTVSVEERTGRLRIVSCIDNLVKGQAGSALQNMNLLFELPETLGLDRPGTYP